MGRRSDAVRASRSSNNRDNSRRGGRNADHNTGRNTNSNGERYNRGRSSQRQNMLPLKRRHRVLGGIAVICAIFAVIGTSARMLPSELQSLPYIPVIVAATPWFALLALLALILAVISRRWIAMLAAIACLGGQIWWQKPFFSASSSLQANTTGAISATRANTGDMTARVMTFNVYKGHADPQAIVDVVSSQRVEILALQETTDDFVDALNKAGIQSYLPYSQVSSSDGVYGNGLWSATPLAEPVDDEVNSSASFMPSGTVSFGGGKANIRFVSVHTTAPVPGYWRQWRRSLDELALMRSHTADRYVFMGDFNATVDHTPFRNFLGTRFADATMSSGHGFTFTWPTQKPPLPRFAGIDHVVIDQRIIAGQMQVMQIKGADHAALLGTIEIEE